MTTEQPRAQDASISLVDETLADMIASGEYYLNEACGIVGLSWRQVYRRLNKDHDFADLMNEAQEAGLEVRRAKLDQVARGDEKAGSTGDWRRDKLILAQGNWMLEKLHPKKYGPKAELQVTNRTAVQQLSDDPQEAARQYEELMRSTG